VLIHPQNAPIAAFTAASPATNTTDMAVFGALAGNIPISAPTSATTASPGMPMAPSPATTATEEPEAITKWRVDFQTRIRERDAASVAKKERILKEAQEATERFYAEYARKKGAAAARAAESAQPGAGKSDTAQDPAGFWKRVHKQIEGNPKEKEVVNLKANQQHKPGAAANAGAAGAGVAIIKDHVKDTSRMKSLIASLKGDANAPIPSAVRSAS
jgi:hypothetical protein